ncbi:hypothetical protein GLV98_12350 [Halobacillus litoralis]|uniref:Replicative helicase inhibitor G39P N-terminal domain-containing protein n=1 Tax=Halobacillus litoralis TaxID=45668 RepID=A0A845E4T1_9BACI|nr:hypothetical protein [Halobacillus litoralis]MYL50280.1 hypothetical protein [Halobacillus litoralis]
MNQRQAVEVLETIHELYPRNFDVTDKKMALFIPQLKKMDYKGVMRKLSDFATKHPYPPTLAEIAVYPPQKNEALEKMRRWEEEAKQVPEETKQHFRQEIKKLMRDKSHDS